MLPEHRMTARREPDRSPSEDRALGMDRGISRRDFLNATLLASGGLLMGSASPLQLLSEDDWTGYGGVGDYSRANGNTYEIVQAGHRIRNGEFETIPAVAIDTRQIRSLTMQTH
jgi:spermidine dehydrogenase